MAREVVPERSDRPGQRGEDVPDLSVGDVLDEKMDHATKYVDRIEVLVRSELLRDARDHRLAVAQRSGLATQEPALVEQAADQCGQLSSEIDDLVVRQPIANRVEPRAKRVKRAWCLVLSQVEALDQLPDPPVRALEVRIENVDSGHASKTCTAYARSSDRDRGALLVHALQPTVEGMEKSRYRLEAGLPCIDVKVQRIEQLFDHRDPAPFRERDLDADVADYVLGAGADLASHPAFSIVFWLQQPASTTEVEQAFKAHFEDATDRLRRRRRRERRNGLVMLALGIVLVLVLFTLAQLVGVAVPGSVGAGLREGLVIASWVVLWRPVEILIFGWIPLRQERRSIERLLAAKLSVRTGRPPLAIAGS